MSCVLGLDIGGSTTRARLAIDGETVSEASGESASWTAAGSQQASGALRDVVAQVRQGTRRPVDAVCAGAAGSATPTARRWLRDMLGELTGASASRISIVDDAAVILPAAGHDVGLAVICGTGTMVFGCDRTRSVRAGGWGYLLGDEGGGYWLVRSAFQVLLERRDGGQSLGALGEALVSGGDLDSVLAHFYTDPRPQVWAAHARDVLACGDVSVERLVRRGAGALAETAAGAAGRLALETGAIVLAGGLTAHRQVRETLGTALTGALPGWRVETLHVPPVAGAVTLARRSLQRNR